jgi:hypothetical protein
LTSGEAAYTLGTDEPNPLARADVAGISVDPDGQHVWFAHCYADLPSDFNNFSISVGMTWEYDVSVCSVGVDIGTARNPSTDSDERVIGGNATL